MGELNINGHRQQLAQQMLAIATRIANDDFNMEVCRDERWAYYARMRGLLDVLEVTDNQVTGCF